ncbi:MAG: asparagine synthase (glutamine-hydrolyzing) [Candidatus Eisenbacteria bacterium]|uniref:asparagine synthase (glutamine-hydrolyzing) n=1 Tax=Eiseniibacteriota bacterium TaxID=2212470 RepID=A0A849SFD2_UNCEI|nr:asparagine synthase (glutamine-hydrolyzing) [Candidatus Eisenbacteria bacterium]
MCGIAGVFHYRSDAPADRGLLQRQALAMRHRGPDDSDVWIDGPVGLAHRRLAIVDLSPGGHQPMPNEDESLWVTYNGELYEWPEIRSTLAARGHRFRGSSDTEALLHLYEEHGDELLHHLRGMFAFGLFDRNRRRLLIARDRLGIKPLYWHDDGQRLVFASELKALLLDPSVPRDLDAQAIAEYLTFQYIPSPRTPWRGVFKLPPAHRLICDANGPRVERYWSLPIEPDRGHSAEYYRERLRALLSEAVRLRLVADVPLGAFLSGGIDSSAVVALMQQAVGSPVKTFSIGFEGFPGGDELEHARRVARHIGTDHQEYVVRPDAAEVLPRLLWQCDEPFADASIIPTYYVSEMARRSVTVALSGDGGDEAYGGYVTYPWARSLAALDDIPLPLRRALERGTRGWPPGSSLRRKLRRLALSVGDRHLEAMSFFPPEELNRVLSREFTSGLAGHDPYAAHRLKHAAAAAAVGDLPALLNLDTQTYMVDDVLHKVDRASMLTSLEVRVPLLDHKVMEFVAGIPFEYKLRGDTTKWILREAVRDLLPPEILARGKQGFGVPLGHWLKGDLGDLARELLLDSRSSRRGWFEAREVERLLRGPGEDERRDRKVWALLCLELWAQCYVDRPRESLDSFAVPSVPSGIRAAAAGR